MSNNSASRLLIVGKDGAVGKGMLGGWSQKVWAELGVKGKHCKNHLFVVVLLLGTQLLRVQNRLTHYQHKEEEQFTVRVGRK
eukprot:15356708-Ditylum_brightwellii.AAC.1